MKLYVISYKNEYNDFFKGDMKKPARNEFVFDLQLGRVISFII